MMASLTDMVALGTYFTMASWCLKSRDESDCLTYWEDNFNDDYNN